MAMGWCFDMIVINIGKVFWMLSNGALYRENGPCWRAVPEKKIMQPFNHCPIHAFLNSVAISGQVSQREASRGSLVRSLASVLAHLSMLPKTSFSPNLVVSKASKSQKQPKLLTSF
jgi:hypothetical protein